MNTILEASSGSNLTAQIIIIIVLMLLNAFFAASELAILSANPLKLKMLSEDGNKQAGIVLKLQENETRFLSTIQVGITLAGFFSSATAAVSLSSGFANLLGKINLPFADTIAVIVVTLILSYFTLVFGELFPKRIALKSPEKVAMKVARPINFIKSLFKPIVFLLSASCELLVKIFRLKPSEDEKVTEAEVKALVSNGVSDGTINSNEEEMISAVFTFGDLTVKNVMKPRIDAFMLDINDSLANIKKKIKEEGYTRVPVYDDYKDKIIGILNLKDVFIDLKSSYTKEDLIGILRKPLFVTESMKAEALLKEFQNKKEHMALVIDEEGNFSGLITLEDIIEEITGNIYDEYDEEHVEILKLDEDNYLVNGDLAIQDLNKELDLEIPIDSDYKSIGGYLIYTLEGFPEVNEVIRNEELALSFCVLEVSNNRILKIKITKDNQKSPL